MDIYKGVRPVRVLIGCEVSGMVRRAFRALGHAAWSCDLQPPADGSPFHHQEDVIACARRGWELFIVHPPCTRLASSGALRLYRGGKKANGWDPAKRRERKEAIVMFMECVLAPVPRVCIENPVGIMSTRYRQPDQIIQPYHFGEDASKATCLWLKELPHLCGTRYVEPRMVCQCGNVFAWADNAQGCPACGDTGAKPRWANQTDSGQNKLGPSPTRAARRAETYPGIAWAMAEQWGSLSPSRAD